MLEGMAGTGEMPQSRVEMCALPYFYFLFHFPHSRKRGGQNHRGDGTYSDPIEVCWSGRDIGVSGEGLL